jgi:hypothetical protein
MRWEDYERVLRAAAARERGHEVHAAIDLAAFYAETDHLVSVSALSTVDRNSARFYLKAVRGLPVAP